VGDGWLFSVLLLRVICMYEEKARRNLSHSLSRCKYHKLVLLQIKKQNEVIDNGIPHFEAIPPFKGLLLCLYVVACIIE
jgi:hypothetical protein